MKSMIQAYVFDLDGTLHDQEASEREALEKLFLQDIRLDPMPNFTAFLRAWRNAAEENLSSSPKGAGLSFDERRARRVMSTLSQFGTECGADAALELFHKYWAHYEKSWRPYPDALGALQRLKPRFRLGVITNGEGAMQRGKIKACGLEGIFESVLVSGELGVSKPDKAIFERSQAGFKLDPAAMAYVGDRQETDAMAAVNAGWTGIWINRKHMPGEAADPGIQMIQSLDVLPVP
jgi:putative hydrolase of the HAD superfamily